MRKKYADEYVSRLCEEFPQIDNKEMHRIVEDMTKDLSIYLKTGIRGFNVLSRNNTMAQDGKVAIFQIGRVFGRKHLLGLRNRMKIFKNKKNEQ